MMRVFRVRCLTVLLLLIPIVLAYFFSFFSLNLGAEKDAKFATFEEKRNAVVLILRNCLEKLENLRSKGVANDMREVHEQQNIVQVKTRARNSRHLSIILKLN